MVTILGANGIIAREISRVLPTYHDHIRQVSRSPRRVNPTDETVAADLLDGAATERAVAGSAVAYLVAGLRYDAAVWQEQWPRLMNNVISACKRHGTKLVFFDNVYAYGRVDGVMTEDAPFRPVSRKGAVRAGIATTLLNEMRAGELQAMIVRAADFYGPGAKLSFPHATVFERIRAGRAPQWIGDPDAAHSFTYTPDAMALNNLGMLYQRIERVDEGERLLTEALEIRRRAYGEHHTLVAGSLNNLAVIAYQRGDHARAAARFAEILELWRALVGEDHPNTITTSNNLGVARREAGDLAPSEVALRDALAARRRVLGDAHPDVAETMINLSVTVERRGRWTEAEALLRDAMARLETSFPQGNSRTAAARSNLGRMLVDRSRFAEAVPHLELAVRLRGESLGENHVRTAESRLLLGRSFLGIGRFQDAHTALQRAHTDLLAAHGADHPRTREAAAALDDAVRRRAQPRRSR